MAEKIIIDPVTRIEGHLRVEIDVDGGRVQDAWVAGTIVRGLEQALKKKSPADVLIVAQRACGLCSAAHALGAVRAMDTLIGVDLPENARFLRNLLVGADFLSTHILRFYGFLALDYLDVERVVGYEGIEAELLALKRKVELRLAQNDAHPFKPAAGADEFFVNDPTLATLMLTHYFEAMDMRRKAHQMGALIGAKMPGVLGVIPGGVTSLLEPTALNTFRQLLGEIREWINNAFLPDVIALSTGPLLSLGQEGVGKGRGNFLSFGAFDLDRSGSEKLLPAAAMFEDDFNKLEELDTRKLAEDSKYAWYEEKESAPGKATDEYDIDKKGAYSFVKAPRYRGRAMEVGPLARMILRRDPTLLGLMQDFGVQTGFVARIMALALECKLVADSMADWVDELKENMKKTQKIWDGRDLPSAGVGVGLSESPSGSISHIVEVRGSRIREYRLVSATTWNASPRDNRDARGPIEEALLDVAVPDTNNALNVLRVIRSFNPCMSCGAH
ncbi:MAG: nickel-dependent hydrogenase large subunit [Terriglobia bacterium]